MYFKRRQISHGITASAIGAVLAALLAACGSSNPGDSGSPSAIPTSPAALAKAAAAEGTVSLYWTVPSNQEGPLIAAFNKTYPKVKVKILFLDTDTLAPKILAEQRAGAYNADVVMGDATYISQLYNAGALAPYDIPTEQPLPSTFHVPKGYQGIFSVNTDVFSWNPTALQQAGLTAPTTWSDFAKPEWKGHFSVDPGGVNLYLGLIEEYGHAKALSLIKAIGNNSPVLVGSHSVEATQVASGEQAGCVSMYGQNAYPYYEANSKTTKFLNLSPLLVSANLVDLVKNAPHPAAARLLLDWFESKAGQQAMINITSETSVRDDVSNNKLIYDASKWKPILVTPFVSTAEFNSLTQQWDSAMHVPS